MVKLVPPMLDEPLFRHFSEPHDPLLHRAQAAGDERVAGGGEGGVPRDVGVGPTLTQATLTDHPDPAHPDPATLIKRPV